MENLAIYFTYTKGDFMQITESDIEEAYTHLIEEYPTEDKDFIINEIILEFEERARDFALYDLDGDDVDLCGNYEFDEYVAKYVDEHWDETEHPLEDSDGQLHLFDPNEYNE